ncbi:MAG: helix-turn-helix transcriptional regulator [Butyrivibrio sp.]|nr:helix-turn-helix transcriptional regulator [Butyrivibrio sp.]
MSFDAEIGMRIRKIRKERKYSREELAEYADISVNFLGAVETGKKGMKVQYLANIAKALNVTTDYLIYGSEPLEQNAEINAILSSMSAEKRK